MDVTLVSGMIAAISALFGLLIKAYQDRLAEKDDRISKLELELEKHTDTMGKTSDALQSLTSAIKEAGLIQRRTE